ncbi:MAG: serine/threonine-protein kinase [Planctomycetota bacterium]
MTNPRHDAAERDLGRRAGDYTLIAHLDAGGTGDVFIGRDERSPEAPTVAVKVLRDALDNAQAQRRFARERDTLAALEHPLIVGLLASGALPDGRPFLVMPRIEGARIDTHCRVHRLPSRPRIELLLAVCAAVQHAHSHGVVHRDLKPSNILVTHAGRPVLLDFGVAKRLDAGAEESATTGLAAPMTPRYASPEQLLGRPTTPATDVYALGVLLRTLLDGATSPSARQRRHWAAIIARATHAEPRHRHPNAGSLAEDLRDVLDGQTPTATKLLRRARRAGMQRRGRPVVATAAAASILAIALTLHRGDARAAVQRERDDGLKVSEFLVRLLDRARPGALGADATLVATLDAAEVDLSATFAGAPRSEARVRMAYGRTNAQLGRWQRAETHLRRALVLMEQVPDFHPGSTPYCTQLLQLVLERQGRPREAAALGGAARRAR